MASILSIAGLLMNLTGVLLLFRYGMPYRVPSQGGDFYVTETPSPEGLKTDVRYRRLGFIGLALVIIGTLFQAAAAIYQPHPQRTAEDDVIYDRCLMAEGGNTVSCDAMMRLIDRERIAAAAMKQKAAQYLAAGFTKREVVKWAADQGFVGSDLSDAVGISLKDLQSGNY